jgi:hypothetical protein
MTEGEGLFLGLAIAAGALVLIGILAAALKRPAPSAPSLPVIPSLPAMTAQAAVAQATAFGQPITFILIDPATGASLGVYRASPAGVTPAASPYPYPAIPPHFPI